MICAQCLPLPPSGKPTFKEYYQSKYQADIRTDQPLLECVRSDVRFNCTTPRYSDTGSPDNSGTSKEDDMYLVPELCVQLSMPASLHCQAVCIASVLFRLETLLVADELRQTITSEIPINSPRRPSKRRRVPTMDREENIGHMVKKKCSRSGKKNKGSSVSVKEFFKTNRQVSPAASHRTVAGAKETLISSSKL